MSIEVFPNAVPVGLGDGRRWSFNAGEIQHLGGTRCTVSSVHAGHFRTNNAVQILALGLRNRKLFTHLNLRQPIENQYFRISPPLVRRDYPELSLAPDADSGFC
jgi:hypothetical protein